MKLIELIPHDTTQTTSPHTKAASSQSFFLTSDNTPFSESKNDSNQHQIAAQTLDATVAGYLRESLTVSSKKAYQCDLAHFIAWGGTIPATPEALARYLAAHAATHSNATLTRRLVSISRAHTSQGYDSPASSDVVKAVLHGIRRVHGTAQRQVSPILKADITSMVENLSGVIGIRDKALLLVGFAGAFRRSELIEINCTDIEWVEQGMVIHIRHSKTDQCSEGRKVAIPFARGRHCPVISLKQWLAAANITSGFLFRAVTKHGHIGESALSPEAVAIVVKKRAHAIGLDPTKFSGHSLRAGLVTSAVQAGVSSWKLKAQTGHKSDAILSRYVRDANIFIDNAAGAVL
jgi:integrase